jgi:hypothetical protein
MVSLTELWWGRALVPMSISNIQATLEVCLECLKYQYHVNEKDATYRCCYIAWHGWNDGRNNRLLYLFVGARLLK